MIFYTVRSSNFNFKIVGNSCDILKDAIDRYIAIIKNHLRSFRRHQNPPDVKWKIVSTYQGHLVTTKNFVKKNNDKKKGLKANWFI